jgi:hypothetical protein
MEKQNYTEWKLAEAKRIRHKGKQTERDLRLAQSKLDKGLIRTKNLKIG